MRKLIVLATLVLSACGPRATGDGNSVTVNGARGGPAMSAAQDYCAKYGKLVRYQSGGNTFECIKP